MQRMALTSQAACHAFFRLRRAASVAARRSAAGRFTGVRANQSTANGTPVLRWMLALVRVSGMAAIKGGGNPSLSPSGRNSQSLLPWLGYSVRVRSGEVSVKGPDYEKLIDAEVWSFIRATEEASGDAPAPDGKAEPDIAAMRANYDAMCRHFHAGHPPGVRARDEEIAGIRVRRYEPEVGSPRATVVYFHGGGFVLGGLESHDDICAEICESTGYRTISVDYRLAPEHRHPAAFEDARAASRGVGARYGQPVVLVGDSAGGNLAAAVVHAERRAPWLVGQVLIYPSLASNLSGGSYDSHAEAPLLTTADMRLYSKLRFGGSGQPENDPSAAPLEDSDFRGIPPSVIISAECDPLCDDGRLYRDRINAAGARAHWVLERGLVHGYLRARHCSARARHSFARIQRAIMALGGGEWLW
jgi:acetyl esterase